MIYYFFFAFTINGFGFKFDTFPTVPADRFVNGVIVNLGNGINGGGGGGGGAQNLGILGGGGGAQNLGAFGILGGGGIRCIPNIDIGLGPLKVALDGL
jgi:hypothetical protein